MPKYTQTATVMMRLVISPPKPTPNIPSNGNAINVHHYPFQDRH